MRPELPKGRPVRDVDAVRQAVADLVMRIGERHAYEEHLTNVVILEDAIETAEEIGKL